MAEFIKVIVKFLLLNIENVVLDCRELVDGFVEFVQDRVNIGSHDFAAGITDLDLLNFVELADGIGQVHNVLATLREGIKAHEKCVS